MWKAHRGGRRIEARMHQRVQHLVAQGCDAAPVIGACARGVRIELGDQAYGRGRAGAGLAAGMLDQPVYGVGDGLLALQGGHHGQQLAPVVGA